MTSLKLKKEIFNLGAVETAREAFSGLAEVTIREEGDNWACLFEKCIYGEVETSSEFENYVIDLMNALRP